MNQHTVREFLIRRHGEAWTVSVRLGVNWVPVRSSRDPLRTSASLTVSAATWKSWRSIRCCYDGLLMAWSLTMNEKDAPKTEEPGSQKDSEHSHESIRSIARKSVEARVGESHSARIHRILNSPGLAQIQKIMDLSGVDQLQKTLGRMGMPSVNLTSQVDEITNRTDHFNRLFDPSKFGSMQSYVDQTSLSQIRKALDESSLGHIQRILDQSGVTQLSKQHEWMRRTQLPRLHDLTSETQLSRTIADISNSHFVSEMSAFPPALWFSNLILSKNFLALAEVPSSVTSSKLFTWLITHPERLDRAAQLIDTESSDHQAFGTPSVGYASPNPAHEQAMIEALERDEPIESWSESARVTLARTLKWVLLLTKYFIAVVTLAQAVEWLGEKVDAFMTPAQMRGIASILPEQFRWALTTHRLVIRRDVRIRHTPSTKSAIVGFTTLGSVVDVLDEKEGWIQIEVEMDGEEVSGWIYKGYTAPFPPPNEK